MASIAKCQSLPEGSGLNHFLIFHPMTMIQTDAHPREKPLEFHDHHIFSMKTAIIGGYIMVYTPCIKSHSWLVLSHEILFESP